METIFHDADFDLRILNRDFGVTIRGLFDTKVAAQFLGEPAIGLASLLEKHLGLRLAKKYQRADWAKRPLPQPMLDYAAEDTRHLPELRDILRDRLVSLGRLPWAEEDFRLLEDLRWEESDDSDAFLRMKGARDFSPQQLGALRELYGWRDEEAQRRDAAPFRVVSNDVLVGVAREMPASTGELKNVSEVSGGVASRWSDPLLSAVDSARRIPESDLPRRPPSGPRRPYDPEEEARVDRLKAVRDAAAKELGLDRGFMLPRWQLEHIARAEPDSPEALAQVPGMRRWQVEVLGERLLASLG